MKNLEVSEIQIIPIKPKDGLVAFVSCILNGQLFIGNIAVFTRLNGEGIRLVFPSKILPNGKEIQCVYPINHQTGEAIEKAVQEKYEELEKSIGQRSIEKVKSNGLRQKKCDNR